jgi:2,3-bisphosphoglycerate-dependent phosphoglycerate mutase
MPERGSGGYKVSGKFNVEGAFLPMPKGRGFQCAHRMIVPDIFGPPNLIPERILCGWLVRHGELSVKNKWDGWGEYNLSPEGIQSAEQAGHWLSFDHIGRIIASDMPRTIHTAEIIMNCCNIECPFLSTDPNLRPLNVGSFTGQEKTPERMKQFEWYKEHPDQPFPEGESVDQFRLRIQDCVPVYFASPYEGLPTLIVTHSSLIREIMGMPDQEVIAPGGIVAVYFTADGKFEYDVVMGGVDAAVGGS